MGTEFFEWAENRGTMYRWRTEYFWRAPEQGAHPFGQPGVLLETKVGDERGVGWVGRTRSTCDIARSRSKKSCSAESI